MLGFLVAAASAAAFAFWVYIRRETPVRGWRALAAVRGAALALLLLLIVNPAVPGEIRALLSSPTWVALDASLSMAVTAQGEPSPWERALSRAKELQAEGASVAVFGADTHFSDVASLDNETPVSVGSRLAPVLERAVEAGAQEVVVLSDLRLEDPFAVRSLLTREALPARFESLGAVAPNAGMARWELPAALAAGDPVPAEMAGFASEEAAGLTATLEVREEDRLVHTQEVELPALGRLARIAVELPAPPGGTIRYEARVRLAGDVFADDDARVVYADVDPDEGLLLAIDLSPDWELRFLMPVLEQVTGLAARTYVQAGPDRFLSAGGGEGGLVEAEELRRSVETAELLVLKGVSARDPEWLRLEAAAAGRGLVLPGDSAGAALAGVATGAALGGEWYVSSELPPSPLAPDLAGATWQGLPPLSGVLVARGDPVEQSPLTAQLQGRGLAEPLLTLSQGETGRRVTVLASGFWRWAFRSGAPRDAYRRLWSGVAGWLLADQVAAGPTLRPLERVVRRGEPVRWSAAGLASREVTLHLSRGDSAVLDSVFAVPESGVLTTDPLPPGTYLYRAAADSTNAEGKGVEGRFDVEAYTEELRHPPARDLTTATFVPVAGGEPRGSRPLRTHPLPYVVLLGLLCGEWIGRRRRGLR